MSKKEIYKALGIEYQSGKILAPEFGWIVRFEWESFKERLNEYNDLLPTAANGPIYDGGFSLSTLYKFHGLFGR